LTFSVPSLRRKKTINLSISFLEVQRKFKEFAAPLINDGFAVFTDGSKKNEDPGIGAAIFSPELHLVIKHKLSSNTSIFSAEAWTIYQALILIGSSRSTRAAVFSNSKSVLDALSSYVNKLSSMKMSGGKGKE